ncbi:hypothetical protein TNCV_383031 [Trichonephila clavipes]|nr:hypothetical protein TNCV_383031 [Trichonephila clavipes]
MVQHHRFRSSISEVAQLAGCSCTAVTSTNRKWCMDGEMTNHRIVVSGSLIPEESGDCYVLFSVIVGFKRPISAVITTVTTQTVCLKAHCSIHCCLWAYLAGTRIAYLC